MKKIKIKLMADYFCHPIWGLDRDNIGDIDPQTLPLSSETIKGLHKWTETYNAILNRANPATSGFATRQQEEAFEEEGISLWYQLRQELPSNYEVWYFSDRLQKEIADPIQLMIAVTK